MAKKDIRKELVKTGRRIVRARLVIAKGGNISAREGRFVYIKGKGLPLDSSDIKSYVRIDLRSGSISGGTPSSEKYMHAVCYKKRSDIRAVLHLHPIFSTAVASSKMRLGAVSYELLASLGSEICRAAYRPAGSKELAAEISALMGKHNAILLPNHGLLVVGKDLDSAFERARACERACQTLIFSRLLGLYKFLPKKEARRIISLYPGPHI
ncbi:MAG: class II aldolase/adducin family protein [Candidatus Omnitrophica bacterium]|nr:class II aldolase/adducin family protein [Candidatus Omnitrophota bacterium]